MILESKNHLKKTAYHLYRPIQYVSRELMTVHADKDQQFDSVRCEFLSQEIHNIRHKPKLYFNMTYLSTHNGHRNQGG